MAVPRIALRQNTGMDPSHTRTGAEDSEHHASDDPAAAALVQTRKWPRKIEMRFIKLRVRLLVVTMSRVARCSTTVAP